MRMKTGREKYDRIINALRRSEPVLDSSRDIENEVLKRIENRDRPARDISLFIDFLFGWIYIGWVRKSLITVSFILVGMFVWEQNNTLKRFNELVLNGRISAYDPTTALERKLKIYRLSGTKFNLQKSVTISEKYLNQLVDSINDLQVKYKDIMDIIDDDPEIRKIIEQKMNRTKIKL